MAMATIKKEGKSEGYIQDEMTYRKHGGNCLFMFARVCRRWRKAQLTTL